MPINYLATFGAKRLNQVIIPGSHDAGIYGLNNSSSGKTQSLDIGQQAAAGCRWFDIRVTGQKQVDGKIDHKAFHSAFKPKATDHGVKFLDKTAMTDFGGELNTMLRDARRFVENNATEFLILKISKSSNIEYVYDTCVSVLGGVHYHGRNDNLNMRTVASLAGTVITLFSESDCRTICNAHGTGATPYYDGVLPFIELLDEDKNITAYDNTKAGLQYFGKYSNTRKMKENEKGQTKQLNKYVNSDVVDHRAMGVMYWTLTTQKSPTAMWDNNIETRNVPLWEQNGVNKLREVFGSALAESMKAQMGRLTGNNYLQRHSCPLFVPNVVMMDFVDATKCDHVYDLNFAQSNTINNLLNVVN